MEHEISSPHSQQHPTYPYPEADQTSPRPPILYFDDPFSYFLPTYALGFQMASFAQVSPPKHPFPLFVIYVPPNSFFMIWLSEKYLATNTNINSYPANVENMVGSCAFL